MAPGLAAAEVDALYANGPAMTTITGHGYGGIITLKKETDEPLKDAFAHAGAASLEGLGQARQKGTH